VTFRNFSTSRASERFGVALATVTGERPSRRVPDIFARKKAMQRLRIQLGLLIAITSGMPSARTSLLRTRPGSAAQRQILAVKPPTLTINGKNVGAIPLTVTLGGTPLSRVVRNWSQSRLYRLKANQGVDRQRRAGPAVPSGLQGAQGPTGPPARKTQAIALLKWRPPISGNSMRELWKRCIRQWQRPYATPSHALRPPILLRHRAEFAVRLHLRNI
jgi:hypothetical protein